MFCFEIQNHNIMLQFLGVYFEKILKDSSTPLLIRNIQMGLTSIILALVSIYFSGVCCEI